MLEQITEHPIKIAASTLTVLSMLIGGVLTIDNRYAHADDVNREQQTQRQAIENTAKQNRIDFNYSIDQLRKQTLEDKVFEILLISEEKRTSVDKARLEKYLRDLQAIDSKWQNKDKPGQ